MSGRLPLYLSTALPMAHAKKRLGDVFDLFSGGVLPMGAFCVMKIPLNVFRLNILWLLISPVAGSLVILGKGKSLSMPCLRLLSGKLLGCRPDWRGGISTVSGRPVADSGGQQGGKKNGLMTLCSRLGISLREILVVGNTMHDWPMMSVAGYSCAVMDAEEELKKLSGYILNPDSIPVFLISDFIWLRCLWVFHRCMLSGCQPEWSSDVHGRRK